MRSWSNGQLCSVVLSVCLTCSPCLNAGTGKKDARYIGGSFVEVKAGSEGKVHLTNDGVTFTWDKKDYSVPYNAVTSIEYGQKAGRRIGATIGWGVTTLGIAALPMLLSKKRKHFATIGFKTTAGMEEGILVEFGKDINKTALSTISLKSGVKIEFETPAAEKDFRN